VIDTLPLIARDFCTFAILARAVVPKVVDIDSRGLIEPSTGSIYSYGVECGLLNGP